LSHDGEAAAESDEPNLEKGKEDPAEGWELGYPL
jgi:hypothetical protein